ncbi:adenosylmethionine--8-amino-7-oxononanoate transaminase [Marinobacter alexandrii]|uniref:adenosylmethionine--8-amino-7-oxononanoate transaminase n=1 Tax=Marinobacter alexandrii TaxID=2570351 RepID=UPI0032972578
MSDDTSLWNDLQAQDREHVWHPYSATPPGGEVFPVVSANGVRLSLADGRELIDGMASWWCAIHGYNHPVLNRAVEEQLAKMSHVMFGGLTHPAAVKLAQLLVKLTPESLSKVFFSDSGSVSVEVALKMAIQFWQASDKPRKQKMVALRSGYHGDTFGAMSVCDPVTGMHHLFGDVLNRQYFVSAPTAGFHQDCPDTDMEEISDLLTAHHEEIAAVIVEPVVQGAGGMHFYSPDYLRKLRALCDAFDVLLIFDEIATGFGRTGKMFALEHANVEPDLLCLGKSLTGGYMTLAATLCNDRIAEVISNSEAGAFMHGPTFMGNPLACATAIASIELLLSQPWQRRIQRLNLQLEEGLSPARKLPQVADVRTLGAIGVIELHEAVDMQTIQPMFVEKGVWIRPFGKLVYTMPPYTMNEKDLATLTTAMVEVVASL